MFSAQAVRLVSGAFFALLLCACSMHRPADPALPTPEITAFVGVNIIPMTPGDSLLPNHTVLVQGDRIVAIGPTDELRVPPGAARIQGAGRFLTPALADMHVHLEHFEEADVLRLFLAYGVTTVRNMDGREYILRWRDAVNAGKLVGAAIHTAGPILDGRPPVLPDNTSVESATDARAHVLAQLEAGYDFIKVYSALAPEAYQAVIAAARERNAYVVGHVPRRVALEDVLASGQRSIEHLADFGPWIEADDSAIRGRWHWSRLLLAIPVDTLKIPTAAARIAGSGIWTVPTLVEAYRAIAPDDTISNWLRSAHLVNIPEDGLRFWEERVRATASRMDTDDWEQVARGRETRAGLVRALHSAGARLSAGTDTPNAFVVPGASLHEELELLVEAGLTPLEALASATSNAAELMGEPDRWGTIAIGQRADLLLLDANPLSDIRNTRRQAGLMVRGVWYSGAQLETWRSTLRVR